jgi:hypothetical protein
MPSIRIDAPAKTTFLVHLPADLGRRLREHAVRNRVTITGTFRRAVHRYLYEAERRLADLPEEGRI